MASDTPTAERYTPQERRARLRAFADRMLDHLEDMPPPQGVAELERTVRVGLLIERLYARVDIAERRAPPPPHTPEQVAKNREDRALELAQIREHHNTVCAKLTPAPAPAAPQTLDTLSQATLKTAHRLGVDAPSYVQFIDTEDPLYAPVQRWRTADSPACDSS